MIDTLALPFDQYQRYRLVADLLDDVRPKRTRWRILDVGGRTALLRSFLPKDEITLVDLEASDEKRLVLGDGSRLPFADESFDVVAAFDTLEHVQVKRREAFVAECARVAKRYCILAGPYQTRAVEEAERILQQFLKDKLRVEHRYLEEHRHNGLPSRAAIEAQLEKLGAHVKSVGHGNLERWLALLCMSMYMDYTPGLRPVAERFFRFYNQKLYASDHGAPVYRHAIVAAFGKAPLPAGEHVGVVPVAPAGATARVNELAFELADFDRAHEAMEEEAHRLREVNATLEIDLVGHKSSLDELRERKSEQDEVIAALEADLAGHKRSKEDLERDLALQRERQAAFERESADVEETLERDLAGHKDVIAALEKDLEEHAGVIAELRELSDGFEKELEKTRALRESEEKAYEAVRAELEALLAEHKHAILVLEEDLEGHKSALSAERELREEEGSALRGAIGELERDLEEHQKVIGALEDELAQHRQAIRELEADVEARKAAVVALEDDLGRQRQRILRLEADLEQHRQVLATLEADLAGHRAVVAELRREAGAMRSEQERLVDELNRTHQALDGARGEIARAAQALREKEALIGVLRGELRHRWRSLKRALWLRRPTP